MTVLLPLVFALLSSMGGNDGLVGANPEARVTDSLRIDIEHSEVFITSYDFEYGYQLWRPNDLQTRFFVRFSNPEIEVAFNDFESKTQSGTYVGKKTYCECTGRLHYENGVVSFFEVRRARLFAE